MPYFETGLWLILIVVATAFTFVSFKMPGQGKIAFHIIAVTLWNWIRKYTNLMESYLDQIVPNVSDKWRADEIFIKVRGNPKYLFALMDDETRFWIAKEMSDKKHGFDARNLFAKGREVAGKKPKVLVTDGLHSFGVAFRKKYWTIKAPRSVHVKNITLKGDKNNNKMERLNGEIRDREKVMRGLKKEDTPIIDGYKIFHNYIRTHEGLDGKTPAEASGIKIEGNNKWITLIQNAQVSKVNIDKNQKEVS